MVETATKIKDPVKYVARIRNWSLDDVEIIRPLGDGKFGHVFLVREVVSGLEVVLKVYFKSELKKAGLKKQLRKDLASHAKLRHPNIIRLYGYFHDKYNIYLVTEYAGGGTVYDELKKQGGLNEVRSCMLLVELVGVSMYCVNMDITIRDMNPERLLFTPEGDVKLTGFIMPISAPSTQRILMDYRPPELIQGRHYDHRAMLWELGILMFELLVGKLPFSADSKSESLKKKAILEYAFPDFVSEGSKNLINKLLQKHPKDRIPLEGVLVHPWVEENVDVEFILNQVESRMSRPRGLNDSIIAAPPDLNASLSTIDEADSAMDDTD